jgi:hypothetical protein
MERIRCCCASIRPGDSRGQCLLAKKYEYAEYRDWSAQFYAHQPAVLGIADDERGDARKHRVLLICANAAKSLKVRATNFCKTGSRRFEPCGRPATFSLIAKDLPDSSLPQSPSFSLRCARTCRRSQSSQQSKPVLLSYRWAGFFHCVQILGANPGMQFSGSRQHRFVVIEKPAVP